MKRMVSEFEKRLSAEKATIGDASGYRSRKSPLMNPSRCKMFEHLCERPCSPLSEIAVELGMSGSTARWHIQKLVASGFVATRSDGDVLYFPNNLVVPDDVGVLRMLSSRKTRMLLEEIRKRPGIPQKELCASLGLNVRTVTSHIYGMRIQGLVETYIDGKFKRYYLTSLISDKKASYRKRMNDFKRSFLKKAVHEGLRPRVVLSTPDLLRVRIYAGERDKILALCANPFSAFG